MDAWKNRFEDLIHEINNLKTPSTIRIEELQKIIVDHYKDQLTSLYQEIDSNRLHTETMLLSQEAYNLIFGGHDEDQ